ncbi:hypothetical protein C4D60_Mb04t34420 [Musa balbisiana]|uniref:Uncharacterized protein n=1 Tax=Musa balbisiana TaxID=52838 RepID=A0A4S8KGU8_MUSBA|nr:hypothetical protein C4D60_Mb04t34420 [Musa balbisiana]
MLDVIHTLLTIYIIFQVEAPNPALPPPTPRRLLPCSYHRRRLIHSDDKANQTRTLKKNPWTAQRPRRYLHRRSRQGIRLHQRQKIPVAAAAETLHWHDLRTRRCMTAGAWHVRGGEHSYGRPVPERI